MNLNSTDLMEISVSNKKFSLEMKLMYKIMVHRAENVCYTTGAFALLSFMDRSLTD